MTFSTAASHARLALALVSCCLFCPLESKAQRPLPAGPDAYTNAQFTKELLAYELRILEAYDKHTKDPPELHKAVREFLSADRRFALGLSGKTGRYSFYEPGVELIKKGSNDPLVLNTTAIASFYKNVKQEETLDLLRRADEAIAKSTYPARERALVAGRSFAFHYMLSRSRRVPRSQRIAKPDNRTPVEAIARWVIAEGKAKEDQRFLWHGVRRLYTFQHDGFLCPLSPDLLAELLEQQGGANPWILNMLKGYYLARSTWPKYHSEDEFGQEKFKSNMTTVGQYFLLAWEHNPRFPEAPAELITISRVGLVKETPRFWFDQTVAAQLDYAKAYTHLRTALQPEYGGSASEMYKFGRDCARTERFDTEIPFELLESLQAIERVLGYDAEIWRKRGVYDNVYQLCEKAIASPVFNGEPQTEASRKWIRATQIATGARAQRYKDIVDLFDKTDEVNLIRAMYMYHVTTTIPKLKSLAEAASSGSPLVLAAENAIKNIRDSESVAEARSKLAAAAKESSGQGKDWFEYWQFTLDLYAGFYSGKWVDVTFPKQLTRLAGVKQWKLEGDRTLVSSGAEPLRMESLSRITPPFELTIDIETRQMAPETQISGILLGLDHRNAYQPLGRLFGINSKTNRLGAPRGGSPLFVDGKLEDVNHLHVRAWNGYYELLVNGSRIFSTADNRFSPAGSFAFWTPGSRDTKVLVHYSNLRIRRLDYGAPPDHTDQNARVEYYTERIEDNSEDVFAYLDRADAYLVLREKRRAKADYEKVFELGQDLPDVHVKLGLILASGGQYEKALGHYQTALTKQADNVSALNRLAWLEATCPDKTFRDGAKAVTHATRAYEIGGKRSSLLVALAAAHAENGDFAVAISSLRDRMKHPQDNQPLIDKMLAAFEKEQPYRDQ